MTIIQPNQQKSKIKLLIFLLILIVFGGAYLNILVYNETTDLRHFLKENEKALEHLQVLNAELKNQLYAKLDAENIKKAAGELGLILEKNPTYLEAKSADDLVATL